MVKNSITISSQNLSLASARKAIAGNTSGYFQVVSFYIAAEEGTSEYADSTGFIVKFDEDLTVLGGNYPFRSRIYNVNGTPITTRGRGASSQKVMGENQFFVATANAEDFDEDGYLFFAAIQFPDTVAVGDTFNIEIIKNIGLEDAPILCEYSLASEQDREDSSTYTRSHIINGTITIV